MKQVTAVIGVAVAVLTASPAAGQVICAGTRFEVKTPPFSAVPYVNLTMDKKKGPWLLDYGTTMSAVSSSFWSAPSEGKPVELSGFSFPTVPAGKHSYSVDPKSTAPIGVGEPRGVVGTDILRSATVEFHYEDANDPFVVVSKPGCDAQKVWDQGFFRVRQKGYFGAKGSGSSLPNVPVVFIQLEQRSQRKDEPEPAQPKRGGLTWAQIDTGYDDPYWPFSIDINEAYLSELKKLDPPPVLVGISQVGGCKDESSRREVYSMPGWKLQVADETGIPMASRWFDSFYFVVKPKETACGGIGPMTVPAAQLGSSFVRAFGTTIIMPDTGDVFIKTPKL